MEGIYNDKLAGIAPVRSRFVLPSMVANFELAVVALAVGIAVYFAWWMEPDWRLAGIVLAAVSAAALWRRSGWLVLLACAVAGFTLAAFHTATVSPNPLDREQRLVVSGHVVAVDTGGPMRRLVIDVDEVDRLPRTGLPERVRVRVGRAVREVRVGEGITLPAVLSPLPGPAVPHGYDPARRAFYQALAGSGFAIGPPEPYEIELTRRQRFGVWLEGRRRAIAARVMESAPEETAGLQAALLTGLRDDIPEAQRDALRASGLAHILAISGLHMGMVAFGVFGFVASALALLPVAAARDMRKPAALVAIVAATAYLGLSGASVATQRAYIMVVIAFLAILLDRRAISLRSVAVAAALTLALHPEALMSVGFQMSFAAVTALVVVYREWAERWPRVRARGLGQRITSFYGSLAGTSLVAGAATGGFAMFHFGRIANYGLLGNLAAMAVFPVVMLFGILALLGMPLGWEGAPLAVMGWLLGFMLWVAEWVAGLPGAVGTVKASHPAALALYGAGFTAACFATKRSVMAGAGLIAAAALVWLASPSSSLRVTDDGRVSVFAHGQAYTSSLRADRYGRNLFAREQGEGEVAWQSYRETLADCDALGCRFAVDEYWVSVVEEASEVPQACADSDLVILPERAAGVVAKRNCRAVLLDGPALRELGGAHIDTARALSVRAVSRERRARRPWGVARG